MNTPESIELPEPDTASMALSGRSIDYIDGYEDGWESALEEARSAIAAWNRRALPAGWREIESAPKMNVVLVAHIDVRGRVFWVHAAKREPMGWITPTGDIVQSPTHWQPLPAAPGSASSQGKE